jgi:hypothetical protein
MQNLQCALRLHRVLSVFQGFTKILSDPLLDRLSDLLKLAHLNDLIIAN